MGTTKIDHRFSGLNEQIDYYLNMHHERGCLSDMQKDHLRSLRDILLKEYEKVTPMWYLQEIAITLEAKPRFTERTEKGQGVKTIKELAVKKGDGIYLLYADHLSCDAVLVFVVQDSKIIEEQELTAWGGESIDFTFNRFKSEKYPDLKVYYFTAAWYTFPMRWRENPQAVGNLIDSAMEEIPVKIINLIH